MTARAALLSALLVSGACADGLTSGPLGDLWTPKEGRSRRASSAHPDWASNFDFAQPQPDEELVLADLKGPGIIRHLWFTIDSADPYYPRNLLLRMYWDGEETPSVEAPFGDFFAVGHGMRRVVESVPVQVSSDGRAYNCFWPMPFAGSARLTLTNEGPVRVQACYYYVDWVELDDLREHSPYFHVRYRQEYPVEEDSSYLFAEADRPGHYVGTVLSIYSAERGWPGEGDDRFYIDGEEMPSMVGTGTEDYFSDAWGFRLFTHPSYGVTVWEGDGEGCRTTAYRWHISDPIVFQRSLRATIETHGWAIRNDRWDGFTYRPDNYASVAYWYQREPHIPYGPMPAAADRLPFVETRIEFEEALDKATVPEGAPTPVRQAGRIWGGIWAEGAQLFFQAPTLEASDITVPFEVAEAGRYVSVLRVTTSYDYSTCQLYLDGESIGEPRDFYTPNTDVDEQNLGVFDLTAGQHSLRLQSVGKHADSTGYYIGVDALMLRKQRIAR